MIRDLNKGKPILLIRCQGVVGYDENKNPIHCGYEYESRYNRGQLRKYLKEYGEYENHKTEFCPKCLEEGRESFEIINFNLPDEELDELFMEKHDMPEEEKNQRRILRDFKSEFLFEEAK